MPADKPLPKPEDQDEDSLDPNNLDPNHSAVERDELRGPATQHAIPPRLEDEGQSGG